MHNIGAVSGVATYIDVYRLVTKPTPLKKERGGSTMFTLSTDAFRYIATYLDHRQLLDLETTCKWMASCCNDHEIWRTKLYTRIRRDVHTLDPKGMYKRALRAGSPRFFIAMDDVDYGCLVELEKRRDVLKVSCWPDEEGDVAVAITLEGRCLLFRYKQEPEDIGPATDAWIHLFDYAYCVALLHEGTVSILHLERRDRTVLGLRDVDRIVGFTPYDGVLYVVCLVKGGDLIRVQCSFPLIYETVAKEVRHAFVVGAYEMSWSRDDSRYLCYVGFSARDEVRAYLKDGKLRLAFYNNCRGQPSKVDSPYTGETSLRRRCTNVLLDRGFELGNVQDITLYQGSLIALSNGEMYLVNNDEELLARNVLWMRPSDEMMNYIVEP
jgi:hypothetical protein